MDLEKIESPEDTRLSITEYGNFDDTKEQTEATDNEGDFDSNENNKEKHRKSIDSIFISQYINGTDNKDYDAYVVTYSKENNSVLGWYVNIEKNKYIQPKSDVYFRLNRLKKSYDIMSYILCKKILLLYCGDHNHCKYLLTQLMKIIKI
jgi:hypothetical protein